jgi:hypothetical protein
MSGLIEVFSGSLVSPSGRVAVVTSELETVISLPVKNNVPHVRAWVDDLEHPSLIRVVLPEELCTAPMGVAG